MFFPSLTLLITYTVHAEDQGKAQLFRPCMCISCFEVEDAPQSSDRGRVEIEGVYSICPLSWTIQHNFERDGERGWLAPHPHQAGMIFPSWWNVRQQLAIATLLYSMVTAILGMVCIRRGCMRLVVQYKVWLLGRNPDKSLKSFSPCYSVTSTGLPWDFYFFKLMQPLTVSLNGKRGNPYRNLKSETSRDYVQKPRLSCINHSLPSAILLVPATQREERLRDERP